MNNSTARLNIDNLVYLGISPYVTALRWKELYKKNPIGKCQGCGFKIRITDPISKNLRLHFYTKKYIPEVHWIFNFKLDYNDTNALNECAKYIKKLTNKEKQGHIYPCCYNCWNIAVNITKDYNTDSVNEYYMMYKASNPDYINWNEYNYNDLTEESAKSAKLAFNYEYINKWCDQVGLCSYSSDGLTYCGKNNGKCEHTNIL